MLKVKTGFCCNHFAQINMLVERQLNYIFSHYICGQFVFQKNVKVVYVIDEIGKMELFSNPFKRAVQNLIDHPDATIFATIPVPKARPIPFVEQLRSRHDVKLFVVSKVHPLRCKLVGHCGHVFHNAGDLQHRLT